MERMAQRRINKEEVKECIESPDSLIRGEVIRAVKDMGDEVLVVLFTDWKVITP